MVIKIGYWFCRVWQVWYSHVVWMCKYSEHENICIVIYFEGMSIIICSWHYITRHIKPPQSLKINFIDTLYMLFPPQCIIHVKIVLHGNFQYVILTVVLYWNDYDTFSVSSTTSLFCLKIKLLETASGHLIFQLWCWQTW